MIFFECPLCKALNLSQTSSTIQIMPSRPTYIIMPHQASLAAPIHLPHGCVSGSHFIFIHTLHTFSGPSYLHGDLMVSASCAICWEHRHCTQWACRDDSTVISVGRPAIVLFMLMDTVKRWKLAPGTHSQRIFSSGDLLYFSKCWGEKKKTTKKKTTCFICKYNFRLT